MGDLLSTVYPWTKSLHVIAVITWMAGIFYLPRLFVYHVEQAAKGPALTGTLEVMEMKLLRYIMNPSLVAVWVFGLALVFTPGVVDWWAVWPYTKGAAILGMTWYHMWCALRRKEFGAGSNQVTGRQYRIMNEVPTLLLLVIVFSVIARPF